MKRLKKVSLILLVLLSLILALCSCNMDFQEVENPVVDTHEHTYSSSWEKSASGHWHKATCEHTNETTDFAEHTFGAWSTVTAATCSTKGLEKRTCTVCGYEETNEIDFASHTYSTTWSWDEASHFHEASCEHSTLKKDEGEHTFGAWTTVTPATCGETGLEKCTCSVCGYEKTREIPKLNHTYSTSWITDETYHWHKATCTHTTEITGKASHTFGSWTTVTAATCDHDGQEKRTCSICGYAQTRSTTKLDHTYSTSWKSDDTYHWHEATCEHSTEITGKAAHQASDWIIDPAPTYTTTGTRYKVCSVCGKVLESETIPMLVVDAISFKTLTVGEGNVINAKVSNTTTSFSFLNEINESGKATYIVSKSSDGSNPITTKVVNLNEGDNLFYVIENNGTTTKTYTITIRRKPVYTITFNTNSGTTIDNQQVEEGSYAVEQTTTRVGYTFVSWDWDFTQTITENKTITASWTANTNTQYKVEYYQENVSDNNYTKVDTQTLTGTTDTTVNATITTYDHFTYNATMSVTSGAIAGDGTLVLKVYYTRDTYTITLKISDGKAGTISKNGGTYKYQSQLPLSITMNAGYTFKGWYNPSDTKLSSSYNYTYTVTETITITAKVYGNSNTAYKVEHYKQNLDNDEYTKFETENLTGKTARSITATAKTYEHFTLNTQKSTLTGTIAGDGSLVLKAYYTRDTYSTTISNDNSLQGSITGESGTYKFEKTLTLTATPNAGYNFSGWYEGETLLSSSTSYTYSVTKEVTITAKWAAITTTPYKVEYYQEQNDGSYSLVNTKNYVGATGNSVSATIDTYDGYNYQESLSTIRGTILGDGSLVLKVYYTIDDPYESGFPIVINEVCSSNSLIKDPTDNKGYDLIELYNTSNEAVSLDGVGMSDRSDNIKHVFGSDISVPANGYLVLYACGSDAMAGKDSDGVYLPFSISKSGEKIYMFSIRGTVLEQMDVPALEKDISYGYIGNGDGSLARLTTTIGTTNTTATVLTLSDDVAVFNKETGIYEESFTLTLTIPQGYTAYYTTDCTEPTTKSATFPTAGLTLTDASLNANQYAGLYTGKMDIVMYETYSKVYGFAQDLVDKANVIRVKVYDANGKCTNTITKTYFVGEEFVSAAYSGIGIISIASNPSDMYGSDGMLTNQAFKDQKDTNGKRIEREVNITYISAKGNYKFSQQVGVRLHGTSTPMYNQKSLTVFCRGKYGNNIFEETPIGSKDLHSIILRTDGTSKLQEGFLSQFVSNTSVQTTDYKPVVVFVDGEYYGVFNMYERFDNDWIEEHYDIDADNVYIVKKGDEGNVDGALAAWTTDYKWICANVFSTSANWDALCQKVDVQSLIDLIAAETYIGNADWSLGRTATSPAAQNYACWKCIDPSLEDANNPYADGKWRFVLYDLDISAGAYKAATNRSGANSTVASFLCEADYNGFTHKMIWAGVALCNMPMWQQLITSSTFKQMFSLTFQDFCNVNFANAATLAQSEAERYAPWMVNHFERFGVPVTAWESGSDQKATTLAGWLPATYFGGNAYTGTVPTTITPADYIYEMQAIVRYFAGDTTKSLLPHKDYALEDLKDALGLTGSLKDIDITWDNTKGKVYVNNASKTKITSTSDTTGEATLNYYNDYPITLEAKALDGYVFTGWTVTGATSTTDTTQASITITFTNNVTVTPNFAPIQ